MTTLVSPQISDYLVGTTLPDNAKHEIAKEQSSLKDEHLVIGHETSAVEDDFPDGGLRAWMVLAGGVCISAVTFGYANSWGAFQSYYEHELLPGSSPSNIAWIGSLQYSLSFLPALVVGRLFDIGYHRAPLFVSSTTLVVSTVLVAQCTQYWHFLLCQGLVIGLAAGVTMGSVVAVLSHWFKKRRALSLGVVGVGSSIGGTIFPIIFRKLVPQVGFKWTMRILALVIMIILTFPNIAMRRRLPPVNASGGLVNFRPFTRAPLFLYTVASFLCFLGLWTVLTFIDVSAVKYGVSEEFSFYLVSIANASAAIGRVSSGVLSDRYGPLTVFIPLNILTGVLTFVWPFARTKGQFILISAIYAIGAGTFGAILAAPVTLLGDIDDVGRRVGLYLAIVALGALAGPPISGAVYAATGDFVAVGVYAGSCIMVAAAIMLWARYLVLGGWKGKF